MTDTVTSQDIHGGFVSTIGLQVTAASGDEVTAVLPVTAALLQPYGLLHGGVLCTVVETLGSIGGALWFGERGKCVGVHNATDFLRSAREGDVLSAVALPVHRGGSQQLWRVEVRDGQARLVATGDLRVANLPDRDRA